MKPSNHEFAGVRWPCARLCAAIIFLTFPALAQQRSLLTRHVREVVASRQVPLVHLLPGTQRLRLAIVLPLRNQAELDNLLRELYDPQSPSYRQYLTVQEFTSEFGPTQEDYESVVSFAKANGMAVTGTSPNRLVVDVAASVLDIDRAFHVTMGVYQHPTENRTFYAPDREPSVDLDVPLWHISGLDNFSVPRPLYKKAAPGVERNTTGSGPGGNFLGSDRRAAYYGGPSLTGSGQAVGLMEFDGYALSDVQQYFTNVGQPLYVPINNVLLDGASGGSDGDDTEQVIDIIDAVSMAPGLSQVRVYIAPLSTIDPTNTSVGDTDIFNQMATDNIAKQLSCSWNWSPDDPNAEEPFFLEFASQGQNLFAASGDYGAYNSTQPYHYPEEDPDVTAVGGTDLTTNSAGGSWASEIAWGGSNTSCSAGSGSGGGPSPDGLQIPPYQKLAGVINSSNKGSTTLRNVPDVAAEANCDNYYCANGSCGEGLGGTSLAAPTWAGYLALVNQQALVNGQSTLGFINPTIYPLGLGSGYGAAFHDITVGDNYNSESPNLYPAVTGYDLVTGWGSPNGTGLIQALAGTASTPNFTVSALPTSVSVQHSFNGVATIYTVVSTDFDAAITLSANGQPAGVTVTFSPTSIAAPGAGASTMTMAVAPSAVSGTYTITVTGKGGGITRTSTVTLTVQAWSFSFGQLLTGCNSHDYVEAAGGGGQNASSPLQWGLTVSPPANTGTYNWSLTDSQGTLASGSYCGTSFCKPPTGNNGSNFTASREPVSTPYFSISGSLISPEGCEANYSQYVQAH